MHQDKIVPSSEDPDPQHLVIDLLYRRTTLEKIVSSCIKKTTVAFTTSAAKKAIKTFTFLRVACKEKNFMTFLHEYTNYAQV